MNRKLKKAEKPKNLEQLDSDFNFARDIRQKYIFTKFSK